MKTKRRPRKARARRRGKRGTDLAIRRHRLKTRCQPLFSFMRISRLARLSIRRSCAIRSRARSRTTGYTANGKNGQITRGVSVSATEALALQGVLSLDEWVSESLGGRNLFVQMLSGEPAVNEASLAVAQIYLREQIGTVGVCQDMSEFLLRLCGSTGLKLPFCFESNRIHGAPKGKAHVSEAARQKFIDDNSLDYELFRDGNRIESNRRSLCERNGQRLFECARIGARDSVRNKSARESARI
ncbi:MULTISPECIES: hypothetical protein [Paraburkholderia]|uniref:hypothetical protein n=1 Tax=Paraburkholderia TaxID=1822464 RepID=UPI001EF856B2|nr:MULTISPECIES: hypothetical protein [Paraburkholderia]MDH6148910.1 hypothetical protein [Paraburkholderia sp. WSM4179]